MGQVRKSSKITKVSGLAITGENFETRAVNYEFCNFS